MMTNDPILESGMTFGPFSEGCCYYIEKSQILQKLQPGIKIAEFLLLHSATPPIIWIVEAKSSTPRPETQPDFTSFIDNIHIKMVNTFSLWMAACLKRHQGADEELSENLKNIDLAAVGFRFILVVKGHDDSWLPPLKDALAQSLRATLKIWALQPSESSVVVLNDNLARQYHLIQ